jgi:hypothetical protein
VTGAEESAEATEAPRPPLFAIKGDATPQEVAALVAVLQGIAASAAGSETSGPPPSQWASPRRAVRRPLSAGPGGWRASALPL